MITLLLAAGLLSGCSLLGVYDGACCRFAPPGPSSDTVGAPPTFTIFTIYNTSGQRVGTVVPSPTGAILSGTGRR